MYHASLIAYAFVDKGIREGNPVSQMKLQKLLYLAQGISLVTKDDCLIEEDFQAWKYGPVIPAIYQEYKLYGSSPIQDIYWLSAYKELPNLEILDTEANSMINDVWSLAKNISSVQLSNWTHKDGSPWAKNYKEGVSDIIIPKPEIKEYFSTFVKVKS